LALRLAGCAIVLTIYRCIASFTGGEGGDDEGWEMEDLELPADLVGDSVTAGAGASAEVFVAPPPGVPASQRWLDKRTSLAAEHAAAGQFQSAMSLLFRQLGVVDFEPLKPHMLDLYSASHACLPGLQVRVLW
jgi:coatomer protein complex subunit alpha (xenin)